MSKPSITDLDMNYQRAFAIRNPKKQQSDYPHVRFREPKVTKGMET